MKSQRMEEEVTLLSERHLLFPAQTRGSSPQAQAGLLLSGLSDGCSRAVQVISQNAFERK